MTVAELLDALEDLVTGEPHLADALVRIDVGDGAPVEICRAIEPGPGRRDLYLMGWVPLSFYQRDALRQLSEIGGGS